MAKGHGSADGKINELAHTLRYDHPLSIAARLEQWIGANGGENSTSLLMYEAMKALRKMAQPVSGADGLPTLLRDGPYLRDGKRTSEIMAQPTDEIERLSNGGEPSGNAGDLPKAVITLSAAQLLQALDFIAPDRHVDQDQLETEVSISHGHGHAGKGYYAYLTDYPDEGAILLDAAIDSTSAAAKEQS